MNSSTRCSTAHCVCVRSFCKIEIEKLVLISIFLVVIRPKILPLTKLSYRRKFSVLKHISFVVISLSTSIIQFEVKFSYDFLLNLKWHQICKSLNQFATRTSIFTLKLNYWSMVITECGNSGSKLPSPFVEIFTFVLFHRYCNMKKMKKVPATKKLPFHLSFEAFILWDLFKNI